MAPTARAPVSGSSIKSAERTLDVLELLSASLRPVPTMVVARRCGIPKSSTHHLLNVMRARGWVIYYEHEHGWGLGALAFEMGTAYLRSQPVRRLAHPILAELTAATGHTSQLGVLQGEEVLYLEQAVQHPAPVLRVAAVGVRLPAHLTAVGRAMLAWLSVEQVRALYVHPVLVRRTDRGPRTVSRLLVELQEVRVRGYATETELTTPGVVAIAAAALSHDGRPTAAIEVAFAAERLSESRRADLADAVCAAARQLSEAIGIRRAQLAEAV